MGTNIPPEAAGLVCGVLIYSIVCLSLSVLLYVALIAFREYTNCMSLTFPNSFFNLRLISFCIRPFPWRQILDQLFASTKILHRYNAVLWLHFDFNSCIHRPASGIRGELGAYQGKTIWRSNEAATASTFNGTCVWHASCFVLDSYVFIHLKRNANWLNCEP